MSEAKGPVGPETPDRSAGAACDAAESPGGRLERWLIFLLVVAVTLGVGLRARLLDLQVNWDGLAAAAHAFDVFHAQQNANLAMIGFVQPPLPALLQLPLVLIAPPLAASGLSANLLGAICAGLSAVLLLGLAAECGLSRKLRWPLVAIFALHPLTLAPAAAGAPMALLTTLLLGGAWGLLRWSRTEALRDLIAASAVLSLAVITRYEAAFVVAGALVFLAWRTWRQDRSWSKFEGTLIAFGLPIAYVTGVWIVANWAIMGDPWHFLREYYEWGITLPVGVMILPTLQLSLIAFFPVLALVYHQMRGAGRYPACARPVAWMVLTGLLAPLVAPAAFVGPGADGYWASLVTVLAMVLAGGFIMLAAVLADLLHGRRQHGPLVGTIMLALLSLGVAAWLYIDGAAAAITPTRVYQGHSPFVDSARTEIEAAQLLRETQLPPGRRHIVAGWPGFSVVLLAGRTGEISVIRSHELTEQVEALWVDSRIVVLVDEIDGVPHALQDALSSAAASLTLEQQWRAGHWHCYRLVRDSR